MKTLIVEPILGLSNRLQALLSAQRLAERYGRRLEVIWADNYPSQAAQSSCPFEDLFESDIPQLASFECIPPEDLVRFIAQPKYMDWERVTVPGAIELDAEKGTPDLVPYRDVPAVGFTAYQLLGAPGDTLHGLPNAVAEYFLRLRPVPALAEAIDDFRRDNFAGPMLGVHIRRGDHGPWLARLGVPQPEEADFWAFVEACLARTPRLRVFCATDDAGVKERFLARFGSRACGVPAVSLDRTSRRGIQHALVDLWLLSFTGFVCGSPGSTFTMLASFRNLARRRLPSACSVPLLAGIRNDVRRLSELAALTEANLAR